MNFKKVLAGVCVGAMTMAAAASTVSAVGFGSADGSWAQAAIISNADIADVNFGELGLTSVVIHANVADLNWGWNNGQFYSNSNNGGWQQVSFGGTETGANVILQDVGDFTVTVPVEPNEGGWFEIGWGTGASEGVFSYSAVDFYAGDVQLGTWTEEAGYVAAKTSYDATLTYAISEADLAADSYVVTLTNKAGQSAAIEGNTYFVEDGKYYIGVDVSDIPADEEVTISGVEFK